MVHTKKICTRVFYFFIGFVFAISIVRVFFTPTNHITGRFPPAEIYSDEDQDSQVVTFPYENSELLATSSVDEGARDIILEEKEEEWELENENIPELPVMFGSIKDGPKGYHPKCAKFPDLYTVRFSNVHWQLEETGNESYFFYSAFLDVRGDPSRHPHHPYDNTLIRVLSMSDKISLNEKNSSLKACQFWFTHSKAPVFGQIIEVKMIWQYLWGSRAHYFPYLITCQLPAGLKELPVSVSVVPHVCTNATNNLNLLHRERVLAGANASTQTPPVQKEFGVCVKALDFPDESMRDRLIEWIETLRLLGADKIFFYEFYVDSEIKKVLDYYESRGIVGVTQTTLPGELPNQSQIRHFYIRGRRLDKRLTELIPYNDCFLRHMYDYKYIAVMDTDEIFVPAENISWSDLMHQIIETDIGLEKMNRLPVTTFCFQNHYFLDDMLDGKESEVSDITPNFHMLRHVYRSANSTGRRFMKCFHSSKETLGLHNHFAFFCRGGRCNRHYIDVKRAQMNHYRSKCVTDIKNCTAYLIETEKDTKLWRFKDEIIKRVQSVNDFLSK